MKEEIKIYTDKMNESIKDKLKDDREELEFYCRLVECFNRVSESLFKLKDRDLIREIEISKLQDENKKQKEVIDKAIEKIKKGIFIIPKDTDEVLDILKEVSK